MDKYIGATLESIISQKYPNLELIVIDGSSSDDTCSIIKKYREHIAYFVSEPDGGQYDAINKGLKVASGDIVAWLNADDLYLPWTCWSVNQIFLAHDDFDWICGQPSFIDEGRAAVKISNKNGAKLRKLVQSGAYRHNFLGFLQQESMFWRRHLFDLAGELSQDYLLAADFEYWIRLAAHAEPIHVDFPLACFRLRNSSRSATQFGEYKREVDQILIDKEINYGLIGILSNRIFLFNYLSRLFTFGRIKVVRLNLLTKKIEFLSVYRNVASFALLEGLREAIKKIRRPR